MPQSTAPYHWLNNWGGYDKETYRRLKAEPADTMIAKAERVIPDLRRHILFQDAATPRTYERYTGNTDGATSAWSWNPANRFYKSMMKSHIDTPVQYLLIGSCWASQMGGIPGAVLAAKACAKRIGV